MIDVGDDNRIRLLEGGDEYYPALTAEIDQARESIYFETYIFYDDSTGKEVSSALKRAAGRGVKVHLLLDGVGSIGLSEDWMSEMRAAGVHLAFFKPINYPALFRKSSIIRLHRKIVVLDAKRVFLGGINVSDDQRTINGKPGRLDYAVETEGPLVAQVAASAEWLWKRTLRRAGRRTRLRPVLDGTLNFIFRDNIFHRNAIDNVYLRAIDEAKSDILIANAYFFPGRRLTLAIFRAAARGVRVRLLLQGRVEYFLLHHASRRLYDRYLREGVEIFEYETAYNHAKVAVIDGYWSTVGSSNLDPFSLLMNLEANIVIRNAEFALQLRRSLERVIAVRCTAITLDSHGRRFILTRALSWACYQLVRFVRAFIIVRDLE